MPAVAPPLANAPSGALTASTSAEAAPSSTPRRPVGSSVVVGAVDDAMGRCCCAACGGGARPKPAAEAQAATSKQQRELSIGDGDPRSDTCDLVRGSGSCVCAGGHRDADSAHERQPCVTSSIGLSYTAGRALSASPFLLPIPTASRCAACARRAPPDVHTSRILRSHVCRLPSRASATPPHRSGSPSQNSKSSLVSAKPLPLPGRSTYGICAKSNLPRTFQSAGSASIHRMCTVPCGSARA